MRKEVKLGMTIGGGLIALLVVYMLVAPPSSQNKGGALLATNDKGGNIIDNTPTDATPVSDEKGAAHTATDNAGGLPLGKVPDVQPTKPQQPEEHEQPAAPAKEKDGWKDALDKGRKPAVETGNSAKENSSKPAPVTPKSAPKPTGAKPAATKHESHESHEAIGLATPSQASEAKLYFNPNDAWGGGVSDGVLDTHETPRKKVSSHKEGTETAAAPVGGGGKYVVKSGDTLSSIAQATYGSASYYPHILRANPTVNPNNLKLGTELTLPKVEEVKATDTPREHVTGVASINPDVKIDTTHQYQVQSGDSLYKISLKVYGKSTYVEKIYELNKGTIGSDPKKLKLGMVLELPEKTAVAASGNQGGGEAAEEGQR